MRLKSIVTVIALILIMFMAAIESSIISLALPTIKQDLNAGNLISLIFTAYFIALVIANPIVGELLTRFKIIYIAIAGLTLFTVGSLMSGLSTHFSMLVISRVIQGFGSGVMMSLSQIVPKLAFEIPLRYKIMGIVGSVWGISSIIGTLLGGILEFATWHWLFYINIPIAIIAIILVVWTFHFPEEETVAKSKFDTKGITLFYIFIGLIMFALLNQQHLYLNIIGFVLAILVALRLFNVEKKVSSPFLPVAEFNRMITLVFITDLLTAVCLMGFNLYIPVYLQEQLGLSPLQSGLVIFPLSVAWITLNFNLHHIEAKLSRKVIYLSSFTLLLLLSSIIIAFGIKLPILIACVLILSGLSFGYIYTKDSVIVQEETSPIQMKKMMSFYGLTKNLGASIGSTIMGYLYALKSGLFGANLHNILGVVSLISVGLIVVWLIFYREAASQTKE